MPVHLAERNGKYCVVEPNGTVKKCYTSKEEALAYLRAINMHLKKSKGLEELENMASADHLGSPPIQIISDGTADGTHVMVDGMIIPCSRISFSCEKGDYSYCSMTVSVAEKGENGMSVEKTFNLRHYPPSTDKPQVAAALDPEAKVRNRGDAVFPANSKKVKDNKDHFPINDADQARNALSRVAQYSSVPSWYSGSLSELQSAVRSAVSRKFPNIKVTK